MRPITVTLQQNLGAATEGASLSLSDRIAGLGQLSWALDEELTRVKPGNCSLRIWDEDGTAWAWIQANLQSTAGSGQAQLLPAFLEVQVSGGRVFIGLVPPEQIRRDQKTQIIELQAQDWSVMLRDQVLEGPQWTRRLPRVISSRAGGGPYALSARRMILGIWLPGPDGIMGASITGNLQAEDLVTTDRTGATQYRVKETGESNGVPWARLEGWSNATILGSGTGSYAINVTRVPQSLPIEQGYYTVVTSLTPSKEIPIWAIRLDTVDWLVPGDVLRTVGNAELKVADVDTERLEVQLDAPLGTNLVAGDRLYFTEESAAQLVFEDAADLLTRAALPYGVDLSRFQPGLLPRPVLAWLPWTNSTGEAPRMISDLEPTLSQVRLLSQSQGKAWTGTPEAGYGLASLSTRYVDWTSQLSAAPAQLMPDVSPSVAPKARQRNRAYQEWKFGQPRYVDGTWNPLYPPEFTPIATVYPTKVIGFDYNQLRKLTVDNDAATIAEERWNGSTWSAPSSAAWPVAGWMPCTLVPMIGVAATTGPVSPQGQALLALAMSGAAYELQMVWAGAAVRLSVASDRAKGAVLRTTPWGVYLFGPGGYGKVRYSAGSLVLDWVPVFDAASCILWPETLTALDSSTLYVLGLFRVAQEDGSTRSETWLVQLSPDPAPASPSAAVLWREMAAVGTPRLVVARRDPSEPTRILGILGGRLFQVSKKLPRTIERVNATTMSAGELIEHIAQAQNALVAPRPDGVLEVISRNTPAGVTALTVDQAAVSQNIASPHFFTIVRVSGADDEIYADYPGEQDPVTSTSAGGRALEISNHPMVWTTSHAYALAASYGAFLGAPRRQEEQTWFHSDADTAPPWEALARWARLTVNGGPTAWLLLSLQQDLVKGEAKATLLEAP